MAKNFSPTKKSTAQKIYSQEFFSNKKSIAQKLWPRIFLKQKIYSQEFFSNQKLVIFTLYKMEELIASKYEDILNRRK